LTVLILKGFWGDKKNNTNKMYKFIEDRDHLFFISEESMTNVVSHTLALNECLLS
jgi:hypothetical protein